VASRATALHGGTTLNPSFCLTPHSRVRPTSEAPFDLIESSAPRNISPRLFASNGTCIVLRRAGGVEEIGLP
jgi:hypothetical protein